MKKRLRIFCCLLLMGGFTTITQAQSLDHVLGDILVKPTNETAIETLIDEFRTYQNQPTNIRWKKSPVSEPLNIWLIHFNYTTINELRFLEHVKNHPGVEVAQFNHLIDMRETVPDDPQFGSQWQYVNTGQGGGLVDGDIDADQAWDITTGGLTTDGDTIVAAVLDDGVDLDHEDFGDNLWVNHDEIPNNDIDDDGNGYVDDYQGWSTVSNSDDVTGGGHGTPVAGIVGAQGNNGVGVTGVNWDVKVMIIKNNFNTNEAQVLAAYSYPLVMRRRYNDSNGAEGAFVVSTNASWGINQGQPADAPLWCAFYDTLGHAGIISCGATANAGWDIDQLGDLPTACPSDYMIAVTNMNRNDVKVNSAGYGATTIDLGAHGADAYNTANNNGYNGFGGTSGATPHVTGAVALMYSAPCPNLTALAKSDPAAAAIAVRDYIYDGVDPNASLDGITTTGGRLNLFNSLQLIMNNCGPCPPPSSVAITDVTGDAAAVSWVAGVNADSTTLRYREEGTTDWTTVTNVNSPLMLTNLTACTTYEVQLEAVCPDDETSGFTNSSLFTTDGCCEAPMGLMLSDITESSASLTWEGVLAAESYTVHVSSDNSEESFTGIINTGFVLPNLSPCTEYTVEVETVCDGGSTEISQSVSFITFGCGTCFDLAYCPMAGEDASEEWIESIEVNTLLNQSGSDDGYGDYTGLGTQLMQGLAYPITVTPGYGGTTYDERFKVYIDFNQDGDFSGPNEEAYDSEGGINEATTGSLVIPEDALLGNTRMRVVMNWAGNGGDAEADLCEDYGFGEVEDYCIEIIEFVQIGCDLPTQLDTMDVTETTATIMWVDATDDHSDHNLRYKKEIDTDWTVINNVSSPYLLEQLENCIVYEVQVEANCLDNMTSGYTESKLFMTDCAVSIRNVQNDFDLSVFPSPFVSEINLSYRQSTAGMTQLRLFNAAGQLVQQQTQQRASGEQQIQLNQLGHMPAGIYLLNLQSPDGQASIRLVKL